MKVPLPNRGPEYEAEKRLEDVDAKRGLSDAQRSARQAQQDLTQARRDARCELVGQTFEESVRILNRHLGEHESLLCQARDCIDDLLKWIVNDWEWDQEQYNHSNALLTRLEAAVGPTDCQGCRQ